MRPRLLVVILIAVHLAHMVQYGACVQDDAFISFRYAANWVDGHGLVFNPGERVEGYTNFLWTMMLAATLSQGLNPVLTSVALGMAASATMVWGSWVLARQLKVDARAAVVAPALLSVDAGLALEAVQGLETTFFSALMVWALVWTLRELESPERFPISVIFLSLAALTRPEGVLVFAALGLWRLWRFRRLDRPLTCGALVFGIVVGGHEVGRLLYYQQWLPNTFYAKVGLETAQAARGVVYLASFVRDHIALTTLALIGCGVVARTWKTAGPDKRLLVGFVGGYGLYVAAVGGDFKATYRFVLPWIGALAVLGSLGLSEALKRLRLPVVVIAGVACLCLDMGRTLPRAAENALMRQQDMDTRLMVGHWLRENVPATTVLAIHSAGTIPYAAGLVTIDMWGLSDPAIARRQIDGMGTGTAGHEKTDYEYTFAREPDYYLPEQGLVTDVPTRLPVPSDFPRGFEERYEQLSVELEGRSLNLFRRRSAERGQSGDNSGKGIP